MSHNSPLLSVAVPDPSDPVNVPGDLQTIVYALEQYSVVPASSSARPSTTHTGMTIFETDTKKVQIHDGSTWQHHNAPITCTSSTRPASPYTGQMIFETDTATLRYYSGAAWVGVIPSGTIQSYGGTSVPTGWLACDGSSKSTTTYDLLHSAIGYNYGGSGASFLVPDLQGRTPVGNGTGSGLTGRTIGTKAGTETHQLSVSEMPSHGHTVYGVTSSGELNPFGLAVMSAGSGDSNKSTTSAGGDGAHNNMQPYTVVKFIIKI